MKIEVKAFLIGALLTWNCNGLPAVEIDGSSAALLDSCIQFYKEGKSYQFTVEVSPFGAEGPKNLTQIWYEKPTKLRAEATMSGTKIVSVQEGGESLIFFPVVNQFIRTTTPWEFEEGLRRIAPVFAELVSATPREKILEGVTSATLLPDAKLEDTSCKVLQLIQKEGTCALYIEDGNRPLLKKFSFQKEGTGVEVVYRDWKIDPPMEASLFVLTPPEGATAYEVAAESEDSLDVEPINVEPKTLLQSQIDHQKQAWAERVYVEPFKVRVAKEPWAEAAITFVGKAVEAWARSVARRSEEEAMQPEGQSLIDGGCNDPLVLLLQARLLRSDTEKKRQAAYLHRLALKEAKAQKVSPALLLELTLQVHNQASATERKGLETEALELTATVLSNGTYTKDEGDLLVRQMEIDYAEKFSEANASALLKIVGQASLEDWVKLCVQGHREVDLAWASRGSGWAKEVSRDGWKGFSEHLAKAREALVKSWELHPQSPVAAKEMISVVMGGDEGAGDTVRLWFDRATAAQFDFMPAYRCLLWAYRPRWGGSHEQMFAFGKACLETKRFDTDVPQILAQACNNIASELDDWRPFYQKQEVAEALLAFSRAMVDEPTRVYGRPMRLSYLAVNGYIVGDTTTAAAALRELNEPLAPDARDKLKNLGISETEMRTNLGVQ